jgi:hypothetical protein
MGALSTFLVGLSAFWNVESYWIKQKVLFARVRALRERCQFTLTRNGSLSSEEIEKAFVEYRAMMDDRIDYWEKLASQKLSNPSNKRTDLAMQEVAGHIESHKGD